ncbi:MAG: hypothetical protein J6N51_09515, partial [Selenomonas sp.]|nr:hypothetical protein [Selenomonas sp.]
MDDLTDYRYENPDPIPLLYQTGYLTIWDYDERRQRYTLGFPNREVKWKRAMPCPMRQTSGSFSRSA